MDKIPDVILVGLGVGVFVGGTVWALALWLSGQFAAIREPIILLINKVEQNLLNKIEYHERHDDARFGQIREDLSEIRIRNATKDSVMSSIVAKLEKEFNGHPQTRKTP